MKYPIICRLHYFAWFSILLFAICGGKKSSVFENFQNENDDIENLNNVFYSKLFSYPSSSQDTMSGFSVSNVLSDLLNSKSFDTSVMLPNISSSCSKDLQNLLKPFINKTFDPLTFSASLLGKMLDSWGKPGTRILVGNLQWLGALDECESIESFHYCRTYFSFLQSKKAISRYGTCFPKTCTPTDVEMILSLSKGYLKDYIEFLDGRTMCNRASEYGTGAIISITLFSILIWLALIGTFADVISNHFRSRKSYTENEVNDVSVNAIQSSKEKLLNLLMCFSIRKNVKALLSTKSPKGAIDCINGIRFISMTWVILGHFYLVPNAMGTSDNSLLLLNDLRKFSFMAVGNAYVSVDTFFLLGGLLVAYLSLRRIDMKGGMSVKEYLLYLLHRYLRLTPSLGVVILFYNNIIPIMLSGPVALEAKQTDILEQPCYDYWWTTLLYINNFYPKGIAEQCYGLSWYLANDMQFYIVSPAILLSFFYLEKKYKNARLQYIGAFIVTGLLCTISFVIAASLIWVNDYPRLITATYLPNNPRAAKASASQNAMYEKPYIRIPPYLVGLLLGYIFSRKLIFKSRHIRYAKLLGWCSAIVVALAIIYGPWHVFRKENQSFMTDVENIFYGTFHRFAWSVAVAWVIYACHNGIGGWVNSILSWKLFIPLGRLTYGAYLTHILVLDYEFIVQDRALHFQENLVPFLFTSTVVLSYACAFILSIFVEQPVANLEKLLLS